MRLFIAIDIPAHLKKRLAALQVPVAGCRWVAPEQIHLTLAFLGDVEETGLQEFCQQLATIRQPGFHLQLAGTGCFPDRKRARVLWVGIEPEPKLQQLAAAVNRAVLAAGITLESRPCYPHITLARLKCPPSEAVDDFLDQNKKTAGQPFPVNAFTLFRSDLTARGALHTPLNTFRLAAP